MTKINISLLEESKDKIDTVFSGRVFLAICNVDNRTVLDSFTTKELINLQVALKHYITVIKQVRDKHAKDKNQRY